MIHIAPDAFHSLVDLGISIAVESEINSRTNTITDILRFVFITILLTLQKNILHFRFGKAYIERVRLLFLFTFQVLAFIIGKLVL